MKLQIKDIFQTNRIYDHSKNRHFIEDAFQSNLISSADVCVMEIYSHCLLSNRRIKSGLAERALKIQAMLDRTFSDKSLIKDKIATRLAREFSIENYLDVGVANIEILKTRVKFQFYTDSTKEWRDGVVIQ